ncbi:hypothetical protein LTR84_003948 [Exophiala bonariae]|uniref:FAD/NAD(P)-binding domain-containing protein n=1 Tax=Exophiala bonariae TaxID=1690606 RepID=A0AAV9N5Q5_9EURO|nr:hypothetical protein LTR84_003948 [Exophiala bonariae]
MGSIGVQQVPPAQDALYEIEDHPLGEARYLKVLCIGGGATGLNLAHQFNRHLKNVELVIYEKNPRLGGTWYENTYPGCACDIPSHIYQFLWSLNPDWSLFYATAPEIYKYMEDTAKRFDLEKYIQVNHKVTHAQWVEEEGIWKIKVLNTATSEEFEDWGHYLVNAAGFLNHWRWPDISGLKSFKGELLHSAQWRQEVDLKQKRVAVIGNGSSGIQLVTALQPEASHLTTFIRNPTWISTSYAQKFAGPNGANFEYSQEQRDEFRNNAEKFLAYRKEIEAEMNGGFAFAFEDSAEQLMAVNYITDVMRTRLGPKHKELADKLIPTTFGFGCRRPTPGTGYLEALTKENVTVELDSLAEVTETGIRTKSGTFYELDAIICATGFETSWRPRFPIIGRNNADLTEQWKSRATAYLSFGVHNFPNYFLVMGPNSPLTHGSALPSIEHLTKYLVRLLYKFQTQNYKSVEPYEEAVKDFIQHSDTLIMKTVWGGRCRSWLKGGKDEGPALSHPGSRLHWFQMLLEPRWEDFKWTRISENRFAYLGNGHCTMDAEGKDKAWYMDNPDLGYESIIY